MLNRLRSRRSSKDRGAVLIEAVIIMPLVLLLLLGISEFGFIFRSTITVAATSRSAARVASNIADERGSDYEVLAGVVASLGSSAIPLDNIEGVIVYNATTADTVPAACIASDGSGQGSDAVGLECNFYDNARIRAIAANPESAATLGWFGLTSGAVADGTNTCTGNIDEYYCPLERIRTPNPATEYIGVWIQVRHEMTTGVFPFGDLTLEDQTVMGIEPEGTL